MTPERSLPHAPNNEIRGGTPTYRIIENPLFFPTQIFGWFSGVLWKNVRQRIFSLNQCQELLLLGGDSELAVVLVPGSDLDGCYYC